MTTHPISRRHLLAGAFTAGTLPIMATETKPAAEPFRYMFNTSTIRGQKLALAEEIEIAAHAGYHAIEPWIGELELFVKNGGNLKDLGKRVRDAGLTVESAIGFAEWIVDDDTQRKKGLEIARRDMDWVQQLGGKRLAAPPSGATKQDNLDLMKAAERYRALAAIGDKIGVVPMIEVWGFSKTLSRLGEAMLVAMESGYAKACVLADVYHLYKGGSGFTGLNLAGSQTFQVFHVNDYPATPGRAEITDAQRVYPGDGVAPLKTLFHDLHRIGFRGFLSLELFNPEYWKQDAFHVAKTGLEKLRIVVNAGLAG